MGAGEADTAQLVHPAQGAEEVGEEGAGPAAGVGRPLPPRLVGVAAAGGMAVGCGLV